MRDWELLVRERLTAQRKNFALEPEVVHELAQHLEDVSQNWLDQGFSEEDSAERAWAEIPDWKRLARRIYFAREGKEMRKHRIKVLWFPGLVMMTVAMGILNAAIRAGFQPRIVWLTHGISILFYVPWLAILPVVGALAAYWSRSQGGSVGVRLAAALLTVVTMTSIFTVVLPLAVLIDRHVPWSTISVAWIANMVGWVLVPGAALLLGALPFLRGKSVEEKLRASVA